jgi:hypothetical protein
MQYNTYKREVRFYSWFDESIIKSYEMPSFHSTDNPELCNALLERKHTYDPAECRFSFKTS